MEKKWEPRAPDWTGKVRISAWNDQDKNGREMIRIKLGDSGGFKFYLFKEYNE